MNRDQLEKELAAQEAGEAKPKSGGGALSSSMALILNMELAGVCLGLVGSMGVSMGLTASTIRLAARSPRRSGGCPAWSMMETVGAWAITEPDSGSDALGGMKTSVRRDGDGGYILKGQKTFITNGPYADTIVVFAKLDEGDGARDARPQGPDVRPGQGHGGPDPGQAVQEDGHDELADR